MAGPAYARPHIPPPELAMQVPRNASLDLNGVWRDAREVDFAPHQAALEMKAQSASGGWASEFGTAGPMRAAQVSVAPREPASAMQRPMTYMSSNGMYGMTRPMGMFSSMNVAPSLVQMSDKGKGKGREIDFEAAFAQLDQSLGPSAQETARIEELDDTADLAAALSDTSLKEKEGEGVLGSDFQRFELL